MKSVRERMDIQSAYREVGTYRDAAEICSTTPKTAKRVIEARERIGGAQLRPGPRRRRTCQKDQGPHLGQAAPAGGVCGGLCGLPPQLPPSRGRREGRLASPPPPGGAVPGCGSRVTCSSSTGEPSAAARILRRVGFSRVRFVCFSDNERSETTLGCLPRCLEYLDGVPKTVLADRMGCLVAAAYEKRAPRSRHTGARSGRRNSQYLWMGSRRPSFKSLS